MKQEQPDRIEDSNEAEVAAHVEKPVRDWIAENRGKLSLKDLKSLDWFATSEGERALAEYAKERDKPQKLVEDKAFGFFETDDYTRGDEKTTSIIRDLMTAEVQLELRDGHGNASSKLESIRSMAETFRKGFIEILLNRYEADYFSHNVTKIADTMRESGGFEGLGAEQRPLPKLNFRAIRYLKGGLAAALAIDGGKNAQAIEILLGRLLQLSESPQEVLQSILPYLAQHHKDERIDRLLEKNDYVFDPESNTYCRVGQESK